MYPPPIDVCRTASLQLDWPILFFDGERSVLRAALYLKACCFKLSRRTLLRRAYSNHKKESRYCEPNFHEDIQSCWDFCCDINCELRYIANDYFYFPFSSLST